MENKSQASFIIKSLYANIHVNKYMKYLEIHLKKKTSQYINKMLTKLLTK